MIQVNELWHIDPQESKIRTRSVNTDKGSHLLIESHYSLISKGTEKLVSTGMVPNSMYDQMTVPYMQGEFSFPLTYGYSLVGKIMTEGKYGGKWVHLLHPHQSHCVVRKEDVYCFSNIPVKRATLLSNMETVINAIWDADIKPGDRILICGFGSIGALLAMTLKIHFNIELWVYEPIEEKKAKVRGLGHSLFEISDEKMNSFQAAFNCSASAIGLQLAIEAVGFEGKIIETSWYGNKPVSLKLGGSFHYNRKKIISSQVSHIPNKMKNQFDFKKRKEYAESLLEHPEYDLLLDHEISLFEAPQYFDQLRLNTTENEICTLINYNL